MDSAKRGVACKGLQRESTVWYSFRSFSDRLVEEWHEFVKQSFQVLLSSSFNVGSDERFGSACSDEEPASALQIYANSIYRARHPVSKLLPNLLHHSYLLLVGT